MRTSHFSTTALCKKNINNIINKAGKTSINVSVLKTKEHLEELSRFSGLCRFDKTSTIKMFSVSRLEMSINVTETA